MPPIAVGLKPAIPLVFNCEIVLEFKAFKVVLVKPAIPVEPIGQL